MKYEWVDDYCLAKKGVEKDYKVEWSMTRYMIHGKMFLSLGGDKYGKPIYTVKLEPEHGILLREQFPEIVPGYYSNKMHWNSVYVDGNVSDEMMREMVDEAYSIVFAALPKKVQAEIEAE